MRHRIPRGGNVCPERPTLHQPVRGPRCPTTGASGRRAPLGSSTAQKKSCGRSSSWETQRKQMTSKRAAAGSRQGARGANERAVGPRSVALRGPGPRGPEVRSGGGEGRRGAQARGPARPGQGDRRSPPLQELLKLFPVKSAFSNNQMSLGAPLNLRPSFKFLLCQARVNGLASTSLSDPLRRLRASFTFGVDCSFSG